MMGLPPSELEYLSPYEFNLMMEGYRMKEEEKWKRTRSVMWMTGAAAGGENYPTYEQFMLTEEEKESLKPARKVSVKHKKQMEDWINSF